MYHPYDGWVEAGQGQSSIWPSNPAPSVLGALPYPTLTYSPSLFTYHITNFAPNIFNSQVVAPDGYVQLIVQTDKNNPGYTAIKNTKNSAIALIEWKASPIIEIRGLLAKQEVRSWLRLSSDRSARTMEVHVLWIETLC
ncbi:hypothetical protein DXG03_002961 [Asterophora parasitica]|uniref:Uncharacterized protein n=1 Tax=Asterophora parasitica TaxID=117018 RepID=A0A9P7G3W6_9AGAR|nr:hypothetical protein DXG03_002961 [Asterophora parasitica]